MSITLRIQRFTMDPVTELTYWQNRLCGRFAVPLNACPRLLSFSSHTHTHTHPPSLTQTGTRLDCFPFLLLLHFTRRRRLIPYAICLYATFLWPLLRALYKHRVAAARKIRTSPSPPPAHLSCALRFITRLLMVFKFHRVKHLHTY